MRHTQQTQVRTRDLERVTNWVHTLAVHSRSVNCAHRTGDGTTGTIAIVRSMHMTDAYSDCVKDRHYNDGHGPRVGGASKTGSSHLMIRDRGSATSASMLLSPS